MFLSRITSADFKESQLILAGVTGNFKHGNERNRRTFYQHYEQT